MNKQITLLFLILVSTLMVESTFAQSISKPSIPEFSLQTVENNVQLSIQNQPIIPNGEDTANIFYNIRIKSYNSQNWTNITIPNATQGIRGYIGQTGTNYTIIQKDYLSIKSLLGLSDDSQQVNFQVEAINGYLNSTPPYVPPIGFDPNSEPVIVVNTSGWSETQTLTIPKTNTSLFNLAFWQIILIVFAVIFVVVIVFALIYFKKHKQS